MLSLKSYVIECRRRTFSLDRLCIISRFTSACLFFSFSMSNSACSSVISLFTFCMSHKNTASSKLCQFFWCIQIYPHQTDQLPGAMFLLHGVQFLLTLLHYFFQTPQTLQQLLVGEGQGLMTLNDWHDQGVRAIIKVI